MDRILHVVDVPAAPDKVFAAVITEEGLSSWWTTKVKAPPAEVGSVIEFTFVPDVFNPRMRVEELNQPTTVAWSWSAATSRGPTPGSGSTSASTRAGAG